MLNPLELFLFLTFLLYALLYRPLLALIYALLLLAYYRYSKKKALPTSYYEKSKHCYSSKDLLNLQAPSSLNSSCA